MLAQFILVGFAALCMVVGFYTIMEFMITVVMNTIKVANHG